MTLGILTRIRSRTFASILFAFAMFVRVAALLAMRNIHRFHGMQAGADAYEFNQLALHLAAGLGYCVTAGKLTAFRAPGWPIALAALYRVSYENYPLAYLSLCAMGALTCVLIYLAARHVLDETMSRATGVISALYLPHVYFSTLFLSEPLLILLLSAYLLVLFHYLKRPSALTIVFAGLLLGASILTRPFALLILPITVALLLWEKRRRLPAAVVAMCALSLSCLAVVAPWTARNYRVFHKFVPATTNGGSTFYGANNEVVLTDERYLGSWIETPLLPGRAWVVAAPDEVEHDRREYQLGEAWVRRHLPQMPLLEFYKFARLLAPDIQSGNKVSIVVRGVAYVPVLFLMIIGWRECVQPRRRTTHWALVHGLTLATLITALVFYGSDRFRDATMPALMLYAGLGLSVLAQRSRNRKSFAENVDAKLAEANGSRTHP